MCSLLAKVGKAMEDLLQDQRIVDYLLNVRVSSAKKDTVIEE